MKHVMNKNVNHNGEKFDKGMSVPEGHGHFKMLHDAGHLDAVDGAAAEEPMADAPEASDEMPSKGKKKK